VPGLSGGGGGVSKKQLAEIPWIGDIQRGFKFYDSGEIRVMAVADGYAMCRRPGAAPFIRSLGDIVLLVVQDQMRKDTEAA
jgi:hypothetical protein